MTDPLEQAKQAVTPMNGLMNPPIVDHMPRSEAGLDKLDIREKLLLAAATAAGSDAVAYYAADGKGGFARKENIDLYDFDRKHPTAFPPALSGFNDRSFANEEEARKTSDQNGYYQIAVKDEHGAIQGIVALHPPKDGYVRIQSEAEARQDLPWRNLPADQKAKAFMPDAHMPAEGRVAQLQMAADMIEREQHTLLRRGNEVPGERNIENERTTDANLLAMARDMFRTLPKKVGEAGVISVEEYRAVAEARNGDELLRAMGPVLQHDDNMQGAHVANVAKLMKYTVDALNDGQKKPVLTEQQGDRAELLAMLHDAGKGARLSLAFFEPSKRGDAPEQKAEQASRDLDSFGANAIHAQAGRYMLAASPAAGEVIANHHHGDERYSPQELTKGLGQEGIDRYMISTEPTAPEHVSTLSRMLRVADVAEAITARNPKIPTLSGALQDMVSKSVDFGKNADGKNRSFAEAAKALGDAPLDTLPVAAMDPNTIDRDALCFMIEHGVFDKYGKQRDAEERAKGDPNGWHADGSATPKYNEAELRSTGDTILTMLHWEERKKEIATGKDGKPVIGKDGKPISVEENLRKSVHDDAVFSSVEVTSGQSVTPLPAAAAGKDKARSADGR